MSITLSLREATDWHLLEIIAAGDWVLVTNNAIEFRGRYAEIDLHPGVIFILPSVPRAIQIRLFSAALAHVVEYPDMVNRALDVVLDLTGQPCVRAYALP